MQVDDLIQIMQLLHENQIEVIIDGGWGVDALLGRQTRDHEDLDIAIDHTDSPAIHRILEEHGYHEVPRNDSHADNYVMEDEDGHLIDIHTFHFDSLGKLVEGLDYPFESINGLGSINGFMVRCITVEWMVKFHTGYQLDENDYLDVKALCDHFGAAIPEEYKPFMQQ